MSEFFDDIRYACRRLRQAPAFTALAALTLALGIGANTAVFSVVDPLLLRRLPVHEPDQLVLLHSAGSLQTVDISERAAFEQYSAQHDVLSGVLADAGLFEFQTLHRGQPMAALGEVVSANFFSVLGVQPRVGRLLSPDNDQAGRAGIVLSSAYWTRAFAADPSVVGETIVVNGAPHTIVGVAPTGFFGMTVGSAPDFYAPFGSGLRDPAWMKVVGRLRPGVSSSQARTGLSPVFEQVMRASTLPDVEKSQDMARLLVTPAGRGWSDVRDRFGARVWVLFAVVALVLLVACANVANLMLTRAAGRQHEVAVQLALGATPARLARQFIIEGSVVATLGTAAGVLSAHWASRALVAGLSIGRTPVTLATSIDARVLLFSVAVLGLTALLCGVAPALAAPRVNLAQGLKSRGGAGLGRGARPSRLRQALVVAQIAASVTLLGGTGLLLHSLVNLYAFNVGFEPERVLAVSLADRRASRPAGQADQTLAAVIDGARRLPGVEATAVASLPPLTGSEIGINVVAEGGRRRSDAPTHAFFTSVTPGYFDTLGVRIVAGRGCSTADTPASAPAVIVNRQLAQHLFGETNPVTEHLRFVEGRRPPMAIIGVAADAIYNSVREEPRDFLYLCRQQSRSPAVRGVLFVRGTGGRAERLAPSVQRLVQSIDPDIDIASIKTLARYLDESLYGDRLAAGLSSGFTLVALMIAAVGLYGVLSATVARQTPEIGLRIALGAGVWRIVQFVAGPAVYLTMVGFVLGSAAAFVSSSILRTLLFGLDAVDPLTYVGVVVALAATAAVACYVPTRRAMRVDPVVVLRGD